MVETCKYEDRVAGTALVTPNGGLAMSADYDAEFIKLLHKVQEEHPKMMHGDDNIKDKFGISRSPHKADNSRHETTGALENKLDEMGRRRTIESAKGKEPRERMNVLYSEVVEMMPVTWRLSHVQ